LAKRQKNGVLGQKLGYDRCPYLSFFVRRLEDEIFDSTGRRDLNTEYTIFDPKIPKVLVMYVWMQADKGDLTGKETTEGYSSPLKKGIRLW